MRNFNNNSENPASKRQQYAASATLFGQGIELGYWKLEDRKTVSKIIYHTGLQSAYPIMTSADASRIFALSKPSEDGDGYTYTKVADKEAITDCIGVLEVNALQNSYELFNYSKNPEWENDMHGTFNAEEAKERLEPLKLWLGEAEEAPKTKPKTKPKKLSKAAQAKATKAAKVAMTVQAKEKPVDSKPVSVGIKIDDDVLELGASMGLSDTDVAKFAHLLAKANS